MTFSEFFNGGSRDRELAERIKAATNISLDAATRERMRGFLSEYAEMRPVRTQSTSRASQNAFIAFFTAHIHPIPAVAAILVLIVSGSTVTAAETALPGDALYPFKVHVSEEVRASLAVSPKARAEWELSRAERRLEEAAILDLDGNLSDVLRAEIDTNFEAHVQDAGTDQLKLAGSKETSEATNIGANIEAIRFARENILGQRPILAVAEAAATLAIPEEITTMSLTSEVPAKSAALMVASDTSARARMAKAPQKPPTTSTQSDDRAERPEARSRGNRAAAKARIEATKRFLSRNNKRLKPEANILIQEQLKTASDALSSGEESEKKGDESEASESFSRALQTAEETRGYVSQNIEPRRGSKNGSGKNQARNDGHASSSENASSTNDDQENEQTSGKSEENGGHGSSGGDIKIDL